MLTGTSAIRRRLLAVTVSFVVLVLLFTRFDHPWSSVLTEGFPEDRAQIPKAVTEKPQAKGISNIGLVVASQAKDNTSWLAGLPSQWHTYVYVVDDPTASLTVPENKGREGMAYLTYARLLSAAVVDCCAELEVINL